MLAPAGPYGEERFAALEPFVPGQETQAAARAGRVARVAEALDQAQLDAAREIARRVPDAASAVARASMGDALDDANFLELQRFFDACQALDALIGGCADLPRTASAPLRECAGALERGRVGGSDSISTTRLTARLRRLVSHSDNRKRSTTPPRGRAAATVAAALDREISLPEFIVMREDLAGPLPSGVRVVREAPTYFLCELDADDAVLAALGRRDAAAAEVARAEERVRDQLSGAIRAQAAALESAMRSFGECDVLVAAARFARAHRCSVPVVESKATLSFEAARFLPLELELQREGRAFTPIDLQLDGVAVVTGPNMGGKSACLRTCGFVAVCAAFGLPVPAERAQTALFAEIAWLGVGSDDERDGSLLSSFAREVVRLRDLLERAANPTPRIAR